MAQFNVLILGFCLVSGTITSVVIAQEQVVVGEAAVDVEKKAMRGSSDVSAARIVDRASGATLDGDLEVTFSNGISRLNPRALKNVEWETNGESIVGRLLGPSGEELATLEGTVADEKISGTFRDAAGRTGTWKWTGELPVAE